MSESRKVPIQVWKGVIGELIKVEFAAESRVVQAPTLILWGDQDSFAPREEQELLQVREVGKLGHRMAPGEGCARKIFFN